MDVKQVLTWLNGRKTYAVAIVIGILSAVMWGTGDTTFQESLLIALGSGALVTVRHALAKLPREQHLLLETALDLYRSISAKFNELPAPPSPSEPARPAEAPPRL